MIRHQRIWQRGLLTVLIGITVYGCKPRAGTNAASSALGSNTVSSPDEKFDSISLYKNELWDGGSKEEEKRRFNDQAAVVMDLQQKLRNKNDSTFAALKQSILRDDQEFVNNLDGMNARVFHAKNQGCYRGTFELDPNRPPETRVGAFAGDGKISYDVLTRFSNGVGTIEHDRRPDVRGLGIKVFVGGETRTFDLLFTNGPVPFGRNQAEFIEFAKANTDGVLALGKFIKDRLDPTTPYSEGVGTWILRRTSRTFDMKSLAKEIYWSGHPYLMGQDTDPNTRAVKMVLLPSGMSPKDERDNINDPGFASGDLGQTFKKVTDALSDNYLDILSGYNVMRKELATRLGGTYSAGVTFNVYFQFDDNVTPEKFENMLYIWPTPLKKVGTLHLPAVQVPDFRCDKMAFTPGRYHPDHRPAGNMGRGRIFTYFASQQGRGANATDQARLSSWSGDGKGAWEFAAQDAPAEIAFRIKGQGKVGESSYIFVPNLWEGIVYPEINITSTGASAYERGQDSILTDFTSSYGGYNDYGHMLVTPGGADPGVAFMKHVRAGNNFFQIFYRSLKKPNGTPFQYELIIRGPSLRNKESCEYEWFSPRFDRRKTGFNSFKAHLASRNPSVWQAEGCTRAVQSRCDLMVSPYKEFFSSEDPRVPMKWSDLKTLLPPGNFSQASEWFDRYCVYFRKEMGPGVGNFP